MAWKVIGAMLPATAPKGRPQNFGPLPRKLWVPNGEKRPRAKKAAIGGNRGVFDRDDQSRKAIDYARWLAARDGIEIKDGSACAQWDGITLPSGKFQLRVSAVSFHWKGGGQKIDIPNWNWTPAEPAEETLAPADVALMDMASEGWNILLQAA